MNIFISGFLTIGMAVIANLDLRWLHASPSLMTGGWGVQKPIMDPDNGSGRTFQQDKPRLDRFAKAMKEHSSNEAYIIAYGGMVSYKNEARIRLNCTRKYLMTTHGISRSRLKLIDGGYRVEKSVELFLVEPGDPKPTGYSILNREAVRMTRPPRKKCS